VTDLIRTLAARALGEPAGPSVLPRRNAYPLPPAVLEGADQDQPADDAEVRRTRSAEVPQPPPAPERPEPAGEAETPPSVRIDPRRQLDPPGAAAATESAATAAHADSPVRTEPALGLPGPERLQSGSDPAPTPASRPGTKVETISEARTVSAPLAIASAPQPLVPRTVVKPIGNPSPPLPLAREPRVEVHIGRIEVAGPSRPPAPPPLVPRPTASRMRGLPRGFERLAPARRYVDRSSL
jgi:hypothetical protein